MTTQETTQTEQKEETKKVETAPEAAKAVENTEVPAGEEEATTKVVKKKKGKKQVSRGRAYIKATYNNTIVTFTDAHGNTLSQSSAGRCGFKGPKKSTPYAAGVIVKDASEKVKEMGLKDVDVYVTGIGSGRDGAVRALNANGFNLLSIRDITPMPHNGCRPKKPRRV